MKHSKSSDPSQRQLRVGEQIRHILSETLQRGHFQTESLLDAGKISVTEVRISPDLKNATAYVIGLGGEKVDAPLLAALNEASQVFQKEINRQSNLKFTPRLRFVYDHSFDEASRIEDLLRDITYSDENS